MLIRVEPPVTLHQLGRFEGEREGDLAVSINSDTTVRKVPK